ncbi:MAG: transposase [Candidatus Blackburnbacteria bacterium]|nr:transposase [Candidatus Blackburnbacteria bacterium]
MPGRDIPLVTGEIYHIFNKGIAGQPTFNTKRDYNRFLETMFYYQNKDIPIRLSKLATLHSEQKSEILNYLNKKKQFIVDIVAYCLMPNHFHLLIKQTENNGTAKYTANITNSHTRYFNIKNKREGPLFKGKFQAVRIESEEQLLHVTRYIHLNPYSSYIVKTTNDLLSYKYSSLRKYLGLEENQSIDTQTILAHFKSLETFKKFIFDQADYQRQLERIKHLILE